ncbi:DUF192 domain-containing protein [Halorubrum rubrum]|uniref:DUF192 domain-containing protein n=1 Tax=Halorubrum rubrum TaxID=1126240 RepID=A0ABD5R4M6_9EURY
MPDVRLVHRPDRGSPATRELRTLARDVDVARSRLAQARGLMFRRSIPDDYALVFPFEEVDTRWLHMLFVPFAIDAVWIVDGEVTRVKRLAPLVGLARGEADTVVELPAGAADGVEVGDEIGYRE